MEQPENLLTVKPTWRNQRLTRLKKRRRLWLKVHLYLGLFAGAVLVVIGLTGSILTFWMEIDRWLNPELTTVAVSEAANIRPLADIVAAAQAAMPTGAVFTYAYPPSSPEQAYVVFFDVPAGNGATHSVNAFVNPYTAQIVGTRVYYHATDLTAYCFMGFVFKLHYTLLAGNDGAVLVGILGVLAFISLLTGLIVWWPLTGKWRQALTVKRHAGSERLNYDLHKTFGFYSTVLLSAVFISGVSMNLPGPFKWLVERFSPVAAAGDYRTEPSTDSVAVTVDQAWKKAASLYPDGRLYWFSVPKNETGVYVFTVHGPLGAGFYGRRKVIVDRYGELLHVFDSLQGSGGSVFMQWMWPLHSGYFFGMPGRILVLLSGLACVLLFVTGVVRWLQKRRAAIARKQT